MKPPSIAALEARLREHADAGASPAAIDARIELAWELGLLDPERSRSLSEAALADASALGHDHGRAGALRNLGYLQMFEGGLEAALRAIMEARTIYEALGDRAGAMTTHDLLANLHLRLGALDAALAHTTRALELGEGLDDLRGLGWAHHNLANIHRRLGDLDDAAQHLDAALRCFEAIEHATGVARIVGLQGSLDAERGEHERAEGLRRRALTLWGESGHAVGHGYAHLSLAESTLERGDVGESEALLDAAAAIGGAIHDPDFHAGLALLRARAAIVAGEHARAESDLVELLPRLESIADAGPLLRALELLAELAERRGAEGEALAYLRRRLARARQSDREEIRARTRNLQVSMAVAAAEREAQVIESLLLRTLPRPIVRELRARGRVESVLHPEVTVLFTDFVGFTRIAEEMSAPELVDALDRLFGEFDEIAGRHGLEKLKTIGDAYMAAAGVPLARSTHAIDAALAALEIREVVRARAGAGGPAWRIRIGLASGPLVAGVIGRDKFAYDVWGDTVNTAARMESSGEADRINVSAATHARISPYFECTERGAIAAKNKGALEMHFVERLRPEYAADPAGTRAGAALLALLAGPREQERSEGAA
ncbi:MAG: adenylate/guanylate cyclase domain-containing protein [Nannocystaceae bacterium]